jgi:hypothetical protein
MRVGVHGIDEVYVRLVVALELVARSRAEFEDFPLRSLDEGGNNSGILKGDEAIGWE